MATSPPDPGEWNVETLRVYLEARLEALANIVDERDRQYQERHVSSQEAIAKAYHAQELYNGTHNDLVRKNDAQAKEMASKDQLATEVRRLETQVNEIKGIQTAGGAVVVGGKAVKDESRANIALLVASGGVLLSLIGLMVVLWKLSVGR